ncbi:lipocalin-like domain-containing protein [Mesorhizobium sp.]|uniref:lipocalin-like domain-containing protein n=1 Tax=Mesorhizobium sp. TaxID=1871066 RepID=UPI000FE7659E|nr:lipocalin-like domain-containing protein [Mesorhizobium sp.]RWK61853.1 MAG: lipocalin-like domain-containing protein [Mesorhizobium sp.]RWM47801.1 MAG: lipocalin-like domain-containing protein [Mesorhizobium sp.]RWM54661.1 MAG: lipocalin-like domain-containing protein [Mesorhizobium sp.]RWM59430.1 MAG: lipocalin-like domain-containing protein [Mesorhizobium sp.]RWN02535.1 MAG: lipocalin-like domain-containing protein [Mesorhizobium sp.]
MEFHRNFGSVRLHAILPLSFMEMSAVSQLATLLLGSWRMISWTYEVLVSGEVRDAFGKNPRGVITYAADGRMMVLVLNEDRIRPNDLVPTPEEKIGLYDSMFAYAGTYTVEDDRVIHHIDMSWNATWEGTQQVRFIDTDGRMLTYKSAPAKSPLDGRDCIHTVRFEKIVLPHH